MRVGFAYVYQKCPFSCIVVHRNVHKIILRQWWDDDRILLKEYKVTVKT